MNCEEATKLKDGYLDGELDPITSQTIEQHLRECPKCDQAYKTHGSLIRAIGNATPYYKAPAELRERIQSSSRDEIAERPTRDVARDTQPLFPRRQPRPRAILWETSWNWLALAAAIIFAAIIALTLVPRLQRPGADQFLATQLIASHVRSLMASHLTDVASSDQHTVKPWLDTKLDFAPPVVDLSSEGCPLIGGRLDYLDNRRSEEHTSELQSRVDLPYFPTRRSSDLEPINFWQRNSSPVMCVHLWQATSPMSLPPINTP